MSYLTIKAGKNVITEPIDEIGISLLDFLKKKHNIVEKGNYILAIDGVYQASDPKQGFWGIFINNNLAVWNDKELPYITCIIDKNLPSYPALGASGVILKEGMNIKLEFINSLNLSLAQQHFLGAIKAANGNIIRITFDLESAFPVTTNFYVYFSFDAAGTPTITYPPIRQELASGEKKTIGYNLTLANFTAGTSYSLTITAEYPKGAYLDSDYEPGVIYIGTIWGGGETYVNASADAKVDSKYPDKNYGTNSGLGVELNMAENYWEDSYLKFQIPNVNITFAYLRFYIMPVDSGQAGTITIQDCPNITWTETGITYNTRPIPAANLNMDIPIGVGDSFRWINIDITDFIKTRKGQTITLIFSPGSDLVNILPLSKETANPPNLRIIYA